MSRKALLGKKGRRAAVLGAAGLGGCAVLAACAPVQVGSAAIVGSQRITVSSLDASVANLKTAEKQYGSAAQLKESAMPQAVLSWLVRFAVMNQVAAENGITVTSSQVTAGLSGLSSVAQQDGVSSVSELLVANGIPPELFNAVGRWEAQQEAFAIKGNGGKVPSSTAEDNAYNTAISKAQCTASKTLDISISPQFGRLNYSTYTIVAGADTLSRPSGKVTAASTAGLTPAC